MVIIDLLSAILVDSQAWRLFWRRKLPLVFFQRRCILAAPPVGRSARATYLTGARADVGCVKGPGFVAGNSAADRVRDEVGTSPDVVELREQVTRLAAIVEQQQAEIADLRQESRGSRLTSRSRATVARQRPSQRPSQETTRRSLLKWGGAAAAAATVAVVASQAQSAHAASSADGNDLVIGQANTGSLETSLTGASSNTATALFAVDNSAASVSVDANGPTDGTAVLGLGNANAVAVWGIANSTATPSTTPPAYENIGVAGFAYGSPG